MGGAGRHLQTPDFLMPPAFLRDAAIESWYRYLYRIQNARSPSCENHAALYPVAGREKKRNDHPYRDRSVALFLHQLADRNMEQAAYFSQRIDREFSGTR